VFYWLDKFGIINNNVSTTPTISQGHLWTISEKNAIFWSYTISIASGLYSLVSTFVAEYKRENTLLFSVGYILATFGFILLNLRLGLLSLFVGFIIIMAIRKRNRINTNPNAN
jgi:NADH:ubiquinone oxidoreductase subunit 2 (subunit N)